MKTNVWYIFQQNCFCWLLTFFPMVLYYKKGMRNALRDGVLLAYSPPIICLISFFYLSCNHPHYPLRGLLNFIPARPLHPLRGSTRSWLRLIQILKANHWTEVGDTYGRVRSSIKGAERDDNSKGRLTTSTNLDPRSSQRLNLQKRYISWSIAPRSYKAEACWPH